MDKKYITFKIIEVLPVLKRYPGCILSFLPWSPGSAEIFERRAKLWYFWLCSIPNLISLTNGFYKRGSRWPHNLRGMSILRLLAGSTIVQVMLACASKILVKHRTPLKISFSSESFFFWILFILRNIFFYNFQTQSMSKNWLSTLKKLRYICMFVVRCMYFMFIYIFYSFILLNCITVVDAWNQSIKIQLKDIISIYLSKVVSSQN